MKLNSALSLLVAQGCLAIPRPVQRLQYQTPIEIFRDDPYTKEYRDPWDKKIDAVSEDLHPLPFRNGHGSTILGPQNPARQQQNPDMIRPPSTDHGDLKNMRWSFADSHVRIEEGGWTRQTTTRELATSTQLAGVNMRLGPGVYRELHWHKEAEWAYVLEGEVRITTIDVEGGYFIDDLKKGDLWYFPSGHPHSLQGLGKNGTEFLLVFDNGDFSEESTFLLTEWLSHTPKAVLGANFNVKPSLFKDLPPEKYIFQGSVPKSISEEQPTGKYIKKSKLNFTHHMLDQDPIKTSGGDVRVTDSTNFPISKTVAAAHLNIGPGALREMHWHPNADEWSFFVKGRARVTIFAASGTARTFNYQAGDVAVIPQNMGHFVENLSDDEPLEVLEIFRADKYQDFSLFQWLGESPKRMVAEHLFAGDKEAGEKFLQSIDGAKKDLIKAPSKA